MRNWQWNREAGLLYPRGRHGARKGEGTARTGGDCAARKKADGRQSFRLRVARETRDADRHPTFVHLTLWTCNAQNRAKWNCGHKRDLGI